MHAPCGDGVPCDHGMLAVREQGLSSPKSCYVELISKSLARELAGERSADAAGAGTSMCCESELFNAGYTRRIRAYEKR